MCACVCVSVCISRHTSIHIHNCEVYSGIDAYALTYSFILVHQRDQHSKAKGDTCVLTYAARSHTHTHTHTQSNTQVHMHIYTHTHNHTRTNTQVHTHTHTHTHTHSHTIKHTSTHAHIHTDPHTHTHTHTQSNTQVHMHIYTQIHIYSLISPQGWLAMRLQVRVWRLARFLAPLFSGPVQKETRKLGSFDDFFVIHFDKAPT